MNNLIVFFLNADDRVSSKRHMWYVECILFFNKREKTFSSVFNYRMCIKEVTIFDILVLINVFAWYSIYFAILFSLILWIHVSGILSFPQSQRFKKIYITKVGMCIKISTYPLYSRRSFLVQQWRPNIDIIILCFRYDVWFNSTKTHIQSV